MPTPLSKVVVSTYLLKLQEVRQLQDQINNRITEVLNVIALCFRKKPLKGWWFQNAKDGCMGSLLDEYDNKFPDFIQFETNDGHDFDPRYSKGNFYDHEFPLEFLFMEDNDIRTKILNEIQLGKEEKENKKLKDIKSKQEKEKKKQEILNKLTKEERKILSL
jgi:hypothetical protein